LLIAQGESPEYVANRLGHESTQTVFDVYGHLYEGLDEAATDRLGQARNASRPDQTRIKRGPEVVGLPTRKPETVAAQRFLSVVLIGQLSHFEVPAQRAE
jgi:catalase